MVKEKLFGPEVTEPVPGNFLFDKFRGLSQSPKIFGYLSDGDGKCLQATCLHITFWAETHLRLAPFVESDLEQAMQYRLWGPYHGYPLWRWSQGKEYAPCKCKLMVTGLEKTVLPKMTNMFGLHTKGKDR